MKLAAVITAASQRCSSNILHNTGGRQLNNANTICGQGCGLSVEQLAADVSANQQLRVDSLQPSSTSCQFPSEVSSTISSWDRLVAEADQIVSKDIHTAAVTTSLSV